MKLNKAYHMDCLEGMSLLPDKSVDMILCDLPYGTTQNKWDNIIDFEKLWEQYNRIIKDNGAIILFGNGIFSAKLMISNEKYWRYNLIWNKVLASGHLNANRQPMREHEDILVFYKKQPTYNKQMFEGKENHSVGKAEGVSQREHSRNTNYGEFKKVESINGKLKNPKSILTFQKPHPSTALHSTQKPIELFRYLILTYSNHNDLILDSCLGSGTTAIAAELEGRRWIGFDNDIHWINITNERLKSHGIT